MRSCDLEGPDTQPLWLFDFVLLARADEPGVRDHVLEVRVVEVRLQHDVPGSRPAARAPDWNHRRSVSNVVVQYMYGVPFILRENPISTLHREIQSFGQNERTRRNARSIQAIVSSAPEGKTQVLSRHVRETSGSTSFQRHQHVTGGNPVL